MSALGSTFSNYLKLCARISPFFLVLFFVLIAFFDGNYGIKGFLYLGCILLLSVSVIVIANSIAGPGDGITNIHPICRMFDFPYGDSAGYNPYLNSAIIAFTFVYMLIPMSQNDSYNVELLTLISVLYLVDMFMSSPLGHRCTSWAGIVLGTLFGMFTAGLIVAFIISSDNQSLLFFNELKSNSVVCKRPAKQTFKCAVTKNGQILSGYKQS
jgi:hypothetical protein